MQHWLRTLFTTKNETSTHNYSVYITSSWQQAAISGDKSYIPRYRLSPSYSKAAIVICTIIADSRRPYNAQRQVKTTEQAKFDVLSRFMFTLELRQKLEEVKDRC